MQLLKGRVIVIHDFHYFEFLNCKSGRMLSKKLNTVKEIYNDGYVACALLLTRRIFLHASTLIQGTVYFYL